METITTTITNTATANIENVQPTTAKKTCFATKAAGIMFWASVVIQYLLVRRGIVDNAFAEHIIYQILPLTGALAYWGLKKDLTENTEHAEKHEQAPISDC